MLRNTTLHANNLYNPGAFAHPILYIFPISPLTPPLGGDRGYSSWISFPSIRGSHESSTDSDSTTSDNDTSTAQSIDDNWATPDPIDPTVPSLPSTPSPVRGSKRPLESANKTSTHGKTKLPRIHSRKGIRRLRHLYDKHIRSTTNNTSLDAATHPVPGTYEHIEPSYSIPTTLSFMERAAIGNIDIAGLPPLSDPGTANDDLRLTSLRPSRYIWGGEQRNGVRMHIDDATSIEDHVANAVNQDFLLARSITLPTEVGDSLSFIASTKPADLRSFLETPTGKSRPMGHTD